MFSISFVLISILGSSINVIILTFHSLTKVWSSSIYIVSLKWISDFLSSKLLNNAEIPKN